MARDSEYELLLSKYNVSIAKTQDYRSKSASRKAPGKPRRRIISMWIS